MRYRVLALAVPLLLVVGLSSACSARVIYVNNLLGSDRNDGGSATNLGLRSGPVKTLDRAVALLEAGDRLEILNNGPAYPYYGSLRLTDADDSGIPPAPIVINGNGAILDGSVPIPDGAWDRVTERMWRLEPGKKGTFGLYRGAEAVPEVTTGRQETPNPPAGHWTAWRGAIYYTELPEENLALEPFRIAFLEAGIFLYDVQYVIVRDLTVRHFHLDGVHANAQTGPVILENIHSIENARAGVFAGGTSKISIRGSTIRGNRAAPIVEQELGEVAKLGAEE